MSNRRADSCKPSPRLHWLATALAFVGVLGLMGFPLFPTFFTEDILLHGAFQVHRVFAVLFSALFAFNGYIAMRAFALAFFGEQKGPILSVEAT